MWSHFCAAERHSMYVEDGKECNWCGAIDESPLVVQNRKDTPWHGGDKTDEIAELKKRVELLEVHAGFHNPKNPKPNTKDEWMEFGQLWMNGNGDQLQWMDTSEHGDNKWYDMEADDAWYPYDVNLVYRRK